MLGHILKIHPMSTQGRNVTWQKREREREKERSENKPLIVDT
jgi:hypothetical protein